MKHKRLSNVDTVRQISVIEVKSIRGEGTDDDPVSQITEYFLPDGTRLARVGLNDSPEEIHEWEEDLNANKRTMKEIKPDKCLCCGWDVENEIDIHCEYCKKNKWKYEMKFEDGKIEHVCEECARRNFETEKEHNNKN